MGFESFRVSLQGGTHTFAEICDHLDSMKHVRIDDQGLCVPPSRYFVMEDGQHVIEIEVSRSPVAISCRFTLCHPPSVDTALLDLLRSLMATLGMTVTIRDDVKPGHTHPFCLADFANFCSIVRQYISLRRAQWAAQFGNQQLAARTREAVQRFVIPRCREPGSELEA